MQIYFIRHAQSTNNELYDRNGSDSGRHEDPDITEIGEIQIANLIHYFSSLSRLNLLNDNKNPHNRFGYQFTHIYASPMLRAAKTGWAIANAFNLPLQLWIELHEGGGIFLENDRKELIGLPGRSESFFTQNFPGILLDSGITEQGWWNKPFEPFIERKERATRVWQRILETHQHEDQIALVSHGGFFNYFVSSLLERETTQRVWLEMNNVGISRIDISENHEKINLVYLNKVDFLPADLIT